MRMEKVNEIIDKHNKMLDAMTFEERKKYYAKYGLIITEENAKKRGKVKKYQNKDQ